MYLEAATPGQDRIAQDKDLEVTKAQHPSVLVRTLEENQILVLVEMALEALQGQTHQDREINLELTQGQGPLAKETHQEPIQGQDLDVIQAHHPSAQVRTLEENQILVLVEMALEALLAQIKQDREINLELTQGQGPLARVTRLELTQGRDQTAQDKDLEVTQAQHPSAQVQTLEESQILVLVEMVLLAVQGQTRQDREISVEVTQGRDQPARKTYKEPAPLIMEIYLEVKQVRVMEQTPEMK